MPPEALVGAPMAPGPGLVGRRTELDSIGDFLDALSTATPDSASRLPRAVSIQGPAGIGKTVLWLDAVATAERRGVRGGPDPRAHQRDV
jgi:Cdc6-like AAA superfamily ATPase